MSLCEVMLAFDRSSAALAVGFRLDKLYGLCGRLVIHGDACDACHRP